MPEPPRVLLLPGWLNSGPSRWQRRRKVLHTPWRPIVRRRLPFPALVVYSEDDRYCSAGRARGMVDDWGAGARIAGLAGHLNGKSGLGDWPVGASWLPALGVRWR